jgi:hypothetical protein
MSRMETDNEIEGRKELGPVHLMPSENLGSSEVLEIFVIHNNVNWVTCTLKVVMPSFKSFEDCKKLLVVDVVVNFSPRKGVGVKSDRMDFSVW